MDHVWNRYCHLKKIVYKNFQTFWKMQKSFSERFLRQFVCPSIIRRSRNGNRMFFLNLSAYCFSEPTYTWIDRTERQVMTSLGSMISQLFRDPFHRWCVGDLQFSEKKQGHFWPCCPNLLESHHSHCSSPWIYSQRISKSWPVSMKYFKIIWKVIQLGKQNFISIAHIQGTFRPKPSGAFHNRIT